MMPRSTLHRPMLLRFVILFVSFQNVQSYYHNIKVKESKLSTVMTSRPWKPYWRMNDTQTHLRPELTSHLHPKLLHARVVSAPG